MTSLAVAQTTSRGEHRRWPARRVLAPATLLVLSLPPLIRQPLWYDEVATRSASGRSWSQLAHLLHHTDGVFAGYYAGMHLLLTVSASPWWLRLPSLLAALAMVVLVDGIAADLLGEQWGTVAALVLAVNPFLLGYAVDARPYTIAGFAVTAAGRLALRNSDTLRATRGWAGWASVAMAAHLFAVLALVPQIFRLRRRSWTLLAPCAVGLSLGLLAGEQRGQLGWLSQPSWYAGIAGWLSLSGGPAAAIGALLGAGVLSRRLQYRTSWAVVGWAALPLVGLLTLSVIAPIYLARYALPAAPAVAVLAAAGVRTMTVAAKHHGRAVANSAVLVLTVASLASLTSAGAQALKPYRYENIPAAADYIRDSSRYGDGVAYLALTARLALSSAVARPTYGGDGPQPMDVLRSSGTTADSGELVANSMPAADVRAALGKVTRVWVADWSGPGGIAGSDATAQAVHAVLRSGWAEVEVASFGSLTVALWTAGEAVGKGVRFLRKECDRRAEPGRRVTGPATSGQRVS